MNDAYDYRIALPAPALSQIDPRWANSRYLVSGNGKYDIGDVGCTITALGMAANYATGKTKFSPAYVNQHYGETIAALQHKDLAEKIAGNFARRTVHPKEDLLQIAMIGLIKAARRYDP